MGNAAHAGETHECPFQHYPLQRLQTSPRHTPAIARLSANSGASDRYRDPRAAGLAVKLLSVAARSTSRRPARFSSFDPDRLRA
jgi:hypothetical protein